MLEETSNIVVLTGDSSPVLTVGFDSTGSNLASAGFGCRIYLWNTTHPHTNYNVLDGHSNAITQLQWLDDRFIASCSADKSMQVFDTVKGSRSLKLTPHKAIINSLSCPSTNAVVTGSDDCLIAYSDIRSRSTSFGIKTQFPILSVCAINHQVYFGGIDNSIHCVDIRQASGSNITTLLTLIHTDYITSITASPDQSHILTCSMDNMLKVFNVSDCSLVQSLSCPGVCSIDKNLTRPGWSSNNFIACGTSDGLTRVFDLVSFSSSALSGHAGSVNSVAFATNNIERNSCKMATCGSDGRVILGEI